MWSEKKRHFIVNKRNMCETDPISLYFAYPPMLQTICCGFGSGSFFLFGCGSGSSFTLRCVSGSRFSKWCGSGSTTLLKMIFFPSFPSIASFQMINQKGSQVYKEDGPPLSLGEQLCGRAEPEVLRTLHILHWAHLLSQATPYPYY